MLTCWEGLIENIREDGAKILSCLTIIQSIYFVGYSIFFTVVYNLNEHDGEALLREPDIYYKWIMLFILVCGMVYFLISSVCRKENKNPNELYSFLALSIIVNCLFIAGLIVNAIKARSWLDSEDEQTE